MKTLIVYYSRTGTTKTVATALADTLGADLGEIRCGRYRPGIFRYPRAGYDSLKGNLPPIEAPPIDAENCDLAVKSEDIGASRASDALRGFAETLAGGGAVQF